MAITYSPVAIRGKAYEPIFEELLFENKTISDKLVSFADDIKDGTIFTELGTTATMQAYTSGAPSASGGINLGDTEINPVKVMYYDEFDMNALRTSRFKNTMKPGAWNTASTEFERVVLAHYGAAISADAESKFWTGVKSATKTAIAALTPGTGQGSVGAAEQTWAAAQSASLVDGVIARMIYNNGALGTRIKVAGTTITGSNIHTEYAKVYAAIPSKVLNATKEKPYIYAPHSHRQLINILNTSQTYRDLFVVDIKADKYFYNGVEIKFVPLSENCMVAALPSRLVWCTDMLSDINYLEVNKIANNRDDMFIKNVFTLFAHIANQAENVLYLG